MHKKLDYAPAKKYFFIFATFCLIFFAIGCKSIDDEVTLDDHLANLMNNREYSDVISTIDNLPEAKRARPEYLLYRAQAFCGKAGFDFVALTKVGNKALNFSELERSFSRILKTESSPNGTIQASSLSAVRSLVSFAGYMNIVSDFPSIKENGRTLLMESLLTLKKIPEKSGEYYRKSLAQSFILHSVLALNSVKSSLRQDAASNDALDIFCYIDAQKFASEILWILDHINGALTSAELIRKISPDSSQKPSNLEAIRIKIKQLQSDPGNTSPSTVSSTILAAQAIQCKL
jgi:hypothetical protein